MLNITINMENMLYNLLLKQKIDTKVVLRSHDFFVVFYNHG